MAGRLTNLIHVAQILTDKGTYQWLYLRKVTPHAFTWFQETSEGSETETTVSALNIEEAIRLAFKFWKFQDIRPLNCGFRYTLPERDEHGLNALFNQMVASYTSMNGVYFDEELGANCFVQFASHEALSFWKRLAQAEKVA
jgi:hypothetical protein